MNLSPAPGLPGAGFSLDAIIPKIIFPMSELRAYNVSHTHEGMNHQQGI